MIKSYKYKLKLTKAQEQKFEEWLGVTCLVYNLCKQTSEYHYKATGKSLSAYDLVNQVSQTKKDYDWMKELPKDTLVEPCFRFGKSMKRFFKGAGYPKWAKRKFWKSLVFVQQNNIIRIESSKIKLHKGIYLNYFKDRDLPEDAKIKRITVKKEIDDWYASIMFETNSHQPIPASDSQVVGVDMGVSRFFTLSTGEFIENPRILEKYDRKLRIAQRSLSRKKKGSNNKKKAAKRVAKIHRKIARVRDDFQQKQSTKLIKQYGGFVVEKLNIKKMQESEIKRLNKDMSDVGMYGFLEKLEYKCKWNERTFVKVDPAYTSQECPICTHTSTENRKTQSKFECVNCGYEENADVNAAKNILKRGRADLLYDNVGQKVGRRVHKSYEIL